MNPPKTLLSPLPRTAEEVRAFVAQVTAEEARGRLDALASEVDRHNRLYHEADAPEISDSDYDLLFLELSLLEERFPAFARPNSPTRRVGGAPLAELLPFVHSPRMLSLANAFNEGDLRRFDTRLKKERGQKNESELRYIVEPKLDGLAMELVYENGRFIKAGTRGDSVNGEDVTHNMVSARNLPLVLKGSAPRRLTVRGEAIFLKEAFAKMKQEMADSGERLPENARNAVAGTIRQLDPKVAAGRPLLFYAHSYGFIEGMAEPATEHELLDLFRTWGFAVEVHEPVLDGIESVIQAIGRLDAARPDLPFEVDGAVVKVDDRRLQDEADLNTRSPKWAIAYKFVPERATTILEAVAFSVGRTGVVTPVAHLQRVRLKDVTVSRMTLFNSAQVERFDLRIGDRVEIERAADVIPHLVAVVPLEGRESLPRVQYPTNCPECAALLVRDEKAKAIRCPNILGCPAQLKRAIEHFASRDAMDIEGLGPQLVEQLVDRGWVHRPSDLYDLKLQDLSSLERMGLKSAANLLESIERTKTRPLGNALLALGIPQVGEATARDLVNRFGDLDRILAASEDELQKVEGVGKFVARGMRAFLEQRDLRAEIERLRAAGVQFLSTEAASRPAAHPLAGLTIVLTGTLLSLSRSAAKAAIEQAGGHVSGSVSAKTDFVVAGEEAGGKLEKALRLGVPVIGEAALLEMIHAVATASEPPTPKPEQRVKEASGPVQVSLFGPGGRK